MENEESKNPFKPIIDVVSRHNLVIFIIVVVSGLITSILILNNILRLPYTATSVDPNSTTKFDEATIVRVNSLKTSSDNSIDQSIPSGRVNLFSE